MMEGGSCRPSHLGHPFQETREFVAIEPPPAVFRLARNSSSRAVRSDISEQSRMSLHLLHSGELRPLLRADMNAGLQGIALSRPCNLDLLPHAGIAKHEAA